MMKIKTTMPNKTAKNNSDICILSNQLVGFVYKNLENINLENYRLRRA